MIQDSNIISRLHQGDPSSINDMYDKYADALYGVALRIVKDDGLAQDVVQDAFTKIWKKRDSFDENKARLFTWIMNITRNRAIDVYRSRSASLSAKNRLADSTVYTESKYEMNPDKIGLRDMVSKLDPKYREVIDAVYFLGLTHKEAEEHLDVPMGTIKTRLRKAIRDLREVFDIQLITALTAIFFTI